MRDTEGGEMVPNYQTITEVASGYYRPDEPAASAEFDSFLALLPRLREEHGGENVAVRCGQIVASGVYFAAVLTQAEATGGPFYCGWVEPRGGSVVHFGSPTVLSETDPS